ncbi:hypothetical protein Rsub_01783 [Raphidocelis subcapitata]|uniref:Uncharacterized protein n=1 Tax=Raphidocelis subcapitata TaxID=307507 RepID=A0A2V0NND6_9CHLO|nr:hypothetical protein Rsub_01783 [Raphidocelis subcapitata]|eukprot:GBF89066.1 hypothetical protein Rsub_01783 [Raphidocelis subcapitata]
MAATSRRCRQQAAAGGGASAAAGGGAPRSAKAVLAALMIAVAGSCIAGVSAYPELWDDVAGDTCAHPAKIDYGGDYRYYGHVGPIVTGALATFTVLEGDESGTAVTALCRGKRYFLQLDLPRLAHGYITASASRFDPVPGDIVARCSTGGARRATMSAATTFTTTLNMCSPGTGDIQLAVTYAVGGGVFHQATATLPVDPGCIGTTARQPAAISPTVPTAVAAATATTAAAAMVDAAAVVDAAFAAAAAAAAAVAASCAVTPAASPAATPAAGAAGAVIATAAAAAVATTAVAAPASRAASPAAPPVDILSQAQPDFAAALTIYTNGKNAYCDEGLTFRTMSGVATRNYGAEGYYKLASIHHGREFYLDSFLGAALRGDGDFAGKCCGVRAEAAKAGARWFCAVYSIHKIDAGVCFATGCQNEVDFTLAGEEVLHGMALMSGADPGAAATANPFTLFSASNDAARYFCNMKKKDTLAPLNAGAIKAWKLAAAAAGRGNLDGLRGHYADLEKSLASRFMQYSLIEARAAAQKLKTKELEAADGCRSPCVREAQQAAAHMYWRAAEPIVARDYPDQAAQVKSILAMPAGDKKAYKELSKAYKAIVEAMGLKPKRALKKCK